MANQVIVLKLTKQSKKLDQIFCKNVQAHLGSYCLVQDILEHISFFQLLFQCAFLIPKREYGGVHNASNAKGQNTVLPRHGSINNTSNGDEKPHVSLQQFDPIAFPNLWYRFHSCNNQSVVWKCCQSTAVVSGIQQLPEVSWLPGIMHTIKGYAHLYL